MAITSVAHEEYTVHHRSYNIHNPNPKNSKYVVVVFTPPSFYVATYADRTAYVLRLNPDITVLDDKDNLSAAIHYLLEVPYTGPHWHIHAGLVGCIPNYSSVAFSEREARNSMREYLLNGCDHCEEQPVECIVDETTVRIGAINVGHCGFEYLEIFPCQDDCLEREDYEL